MKKFYEKFIFFFCADLRADDGIPIVLSPHEIYAWHKNTEAFVKQKSGQRPQEVSHLPQFSLYSNNTKRRGQICAISYGTKKNQDSFISLMKHLRFAVISTHAGRKPLRMALRAEGILDHAQQ